jgi:hypothetical protein
MRLKCNACGGIYDDVLPDGMRYFHTCPSLSVVELGAAVLAGKVVLPVGETAADAVLRRSYERATKRDENVPSTRAVDSGQLIAAGTGVTVVGPTPPTKIIVP